MSQNALLERLMLTKPFKRLKTFEEIYAENHTRLHRLAVRMVDDRESASDIVQEVFTALYEKLVGGHAFLYLNTWLYRVTINKCTDHLNRQKRYRSLEEVIALPNNKLAMTGFSIKDGAIRYFVEIVNPATNEEKIFWEHKGEGVSTIFEKNNTSERPLFQYGYQFKTGGTIGFSVDFEGTGNRYTSPIIASSGSKILLAFPDNGELWEYDLTGKLLAKKRLGWIRESVSVEEQKKTLQEEIDKLKTMKLGKARNTNTDEELAEAKAKFLKEMEEDLSRITTTLARPCLSTVIKDSEGNLLYFEYPKEKDANLFHVWVYSNDGGFVCESKFVSEDYDLIINPSRMVFRNGFLYSLQNAKGAKGIPMRLVRFKLMAE